MTGVPATVLVVSNATSSRFETITGSTGLYTVPSLSAGVYTVTVSLTGFKTSESAMCACSSGRRPH